MKYERLTHAHSLIVITKVSLHISTQMIKAHLRERAEICSQLDSPNAQR